MGDTSSLAERSICGARPKSRTGCCLKVPIKIIHDPDPAIYDQQQVFESGGAPTFDSPDISTIHLWPVKPIADLAITVRNLATQASANNTRIDISWSVWGIGMPRTPIGSALVNLARAGHLGSEVTISWPNPPAVVAAECYGIFVDVVHPYDTNPNNNHGEQTAYGFQTSTGRKKSYVVPVRNPTGTVQTINLTAGPAQFGSWVTIVPSTVTLGAGAQHDVMVTVDVPASIPPSPHGTMISATVDILATIGGAYLGGIAIDILFDA